MVSGLKINALVLIAQTKTFQGFSVKYPVNHMDGKVFTIPSGVLGMLDWANCLEESQQV